MSASKASQVFLNSLLGVGAGISADHHEALLSVLKWKSTRWQPATPVYAEGRGAAQASPVIKKLQLQPHAAKILLTHVPEKAQGLLL